MSTRPVIHGFLVAVAVACAGAAVQAQTYIDYYNQGNAWYEQGNYEQAIANYTEAIRLNPGLFEAYNARGNSWSDHQDLDRAVADYTEAIRLKPDYSEAYMNRADALRAKGQLARAFADYNQAIRLNPRDSLAFNNRGVAHLVQGGYKLALADFDEAIRLNPGLSIAYINRAEIRSTCPDAAFRNGPAAFQDAVFACKAEDYRDATYVGSLAAAYAECGDFEHAVTYQEKAQALYQLKRPIRPNAGLPDETLPPYHIDDITEGAERLKAYKAGKPWRSKPKSAQPGPGDPPAPKPSKPAGDPPAPKPSEPPK